MPKVFLVKRRSLGVSVRSWDELPDEKRADTYIPVGLGRLLHDPPEDCRSDGGSSSGSGSSSAGEPGGAESSSSPHAPERETPEPGDAEGPDGHLAAKQRPVARSKIKFTTGTCSDSVVHSCDLCGKGFRLQRMLNRHLKCHNQVKRHLCTFCGKGFNDTFDLKRHVRTHTGSPSLPSLPPSAFLSLLPEAGASPACPVAVSRSLLASRGRYSSLQMQRLQ
ncbi:transcription factor Ovo-like 2 isoform X2 [Macaca thibetana thibetana]|uniref:transcription factor Ovo-like 2 isoform X2 n=1 Tax=Macaca mulatta TaxID=9544 RepID=UPI000732AB21|nr:transcription factor Ovo-like 2 isoform X2 [Macaca mulatta]XP_050601338.1 transcription factor Ovo-like 2 isoform X2 [Macaca thibetana thibetana]